jgi:hypothetical protein
VPRAYDILRACEGMGGRTNKNNEIWEKYIYKIQK